MNTRRIGLVCGIVTVLLAWAGRTEADTLVIPYGTTTYLSGTHTYDSVSILGNLSLTGNTVFRRQRGFQPWLNGQFVGQPELWTPGQRRRLGHCRR